MLTRSIAAPFVCSVALLFACNGKVGDPLDRLPGPQDAGPNGGRSGRDPVPPASAGPAGRSGYGGNAGSPPSGEYKPPSLGTTTPAPFTPTKPMAPVAAVCAQAAPTTDEVANSIGRFVGRFQACDGTLGDTGHAGFEISGTLRWRFLDSDPATGELVPAPDNAQTRGYLQTDLFDGDLVFSLDSPGNQAVLRLSGVSADAVSLTISGPAPSVANRQEHLARATPSPDNGLDNHGDLQGDFPCSLIGTWDYPVSDSEQTTHTGVRTIAFDETGRFYAYRKKDAVFGVDPVDETGTWFIGQKTLNLVTIAGNIGTCERLPRVLSLNLSFGGGGSKGGACGASKQDVIAPDQCAADGLFKGLVYIIRRE